MRRRSLSRVRCVSRSTRGKEAGDTEARSSTAGCTALRPAGRRGAGIDSTGPTSTRLQPLPLPTFWNDLLPWSSTHRKMSDDWANAAHGADNAEGQQDSRDHALQGRSGRARTTRSVRQPRCRNRRNCQQFHRQFPHSGDTQFIRRGPKQTGAVARPRLLCVAGRFTTRSTCRTRPGASSCGSA